MSHSAPPHFAIQLCCPTLFHLKLLCACMSFTPCFFLYVCYFLSLFHKLTFHHLCCDTFFVYLLSLRFYISFTCLSVCLSVSLCNVTSFFLLFYEGEIMFFVFDHQNGEINTKHILSVYSITSNKYSWDLKSEHCVFQSAFGCCEFECCSKTLQYPGISLEFIRIS